jgi:hypothetical protein
MTVAVNDTIERYLITGAGPYAYTWRIFNDTDLQVYALSLASPPVPTLLTYLTHYTVTGANSASGGSITLTAAAIAAFTGFTLDIRANTPEDQPTSIRNQARFLPEIHEDAFDYLSRQIQDLQRRVNASIRFPDNTMNSGEMTPLSSWVSKYLSVDPSGALTPAVLSSTTMTASIIATLFAANPTGLQIFPRTAAEITALVVPTNFAFPSHEAVGFVHPARYGWVSSTTVDQTTIIRNAYAVAGVAGVPLIIPKGNTKHTGQLLWDQKCDVIGESREQSVLLAAGNFTAIRIDQNGQEALYDNFSTTRQSGTGDGLDIWLGNRITVRRIISTGHAITYLLRAGNLGSYENLKSLNATSDALKIDSGTGTAGSCWDCKFFNLDLIGYAGIGLNINAGDSHKFFGATCQNGITVGKGIRVASNTNLIIGYVENNVGQDLTLEVGSTRNMVLLTNATVPGTSCYLDLGTNNAILDLAVYPVLQMPNINPVPRLTNSVGKPQNIGGGAAGPGAAPFAGGKMRVFGGDAAGTGNASGGDVELEGGAKVGTGAKGGIVAKASAIIHARSGNAYSASITIDAATGDYQSIRPSNGVAFTINAPLNPREAQRMTITIANISGGALGVITFNAIFKMIAFTSPNNGFNCSLVFFFDGTNWIQEGPQSLQIPN